MNTVILVIWTVVGCGGTYSHCENDWRPIGEFTTVSQCHKAAAQMKQKDGYFICLQK